MSDVKSKDWLYESLQESKRQVDSWPQWMKTAMGVTTPSGLEERK